MEMRVLANLVALVLEWLLRLQEWMALEMRVLANLVALVPLCPEVPGQAQVWLTHSELLEGGEGTRKDAAHLLASFFLHRNINCYVVVGASLDGAPPSHPLAARMPEFVLNNDLTFHRVQL